MNHITELDILRDVVRRLESAGIEYMLTGSLAMNYYATPRMTRDIDLVVALNMDDSGRLKQLFEGDYYIPEDSLVHALATHGMFNLVHLESVAKVDIIVRKDEDYRHEEFARRQRVRLSDFDAWIVSREDLILSKLVWAKPSHSDLQLRDIANLINLDIDTKYLRQWAPRLDVAGLLEDCLNE
ncbi:MAG TPA: hypothetical protein VFK96_09015 [Gammaproteobacteria bacterium]|nr:hypothetical protein [Gammaproteobacteria bacterium]